MITANRLRWQKCNNKEVSIFIWSCYKLLFDHLSLIIGFLLCSLKLSQMLQCWQDFHQGPGELKLFTWASVHDSPRWSSISFPEWININLSSVQTSLSQPYEPFFGKSERFMTLISGGRSEIKSVQCISRFHRICSGSCVMHRKVPHTDEKPSIVGTQKTNRISTRLCFLPFQQGSFAVAEPSRWELLLALCQQSYLLMRRIVSRAPPDTEKAMGADRVKMPGRVYLEWNHKWEKDGVIQTEREGRRFRMEGYGLLFLSTPSFCCMSVQDTHMRWCRDFNSFVRFKLLAHIIVELCHPSWFYFLRFALRSSPR